MLPVLTLLGNRTGSLQNHSLLCIISITMVWLVWHKAPAILLGTRVGLQKLEASLMRKLLADAGDAEAMVFGPARNGDAKLLQVRGRLAWGPAGLGAWWPGASFPRTNSWAQPKGKHFRPKNSHFKSRWNPPPLSQARTKSGQISTSRAM